MPDALRSLMPGRFDRYLLRQVVWQIMLVWALMLLVFSSLQLIGELRDMRADYQLLQVLWHSVLTMAHRAYILFPFAALAGALLAVSRLVAQHEITVMGSAGRSQQRLMLPVMQAVLVLLLLAVVLGELAGGWLEPAARDYRVQRITGQVSLSYTGGLWLRDGDDIMHVAWPAMDAAAQADFSGINVFTLKDGRLCEWLQADHGSHARGQWQLQGVQELALCADPVQIQRHATLPHVSQLSSDLLMTMALRPSLLSMADLHAYMRFLQRSGLDATRYHIALFQRRYYPFTVLTLVWLGLPLVLNEARAKSRGRQLLAGMASGILLYICYEMTESLTGVYRFNPAISLLIPAVLSLVFASWLYRRRGV